MDEHSEGFVAYPLGLNGVVVGEGETHNAAVADLKSAIRFHIETFGEETLAVDSAVLDATIELATVAV